MASGKEGTGFIPYYKHLLELLGTNKEFKKTTIGLHRRMVLTAVGAGVGGVVAGPSGALVGGIAGISRQIASAAVGAGVGGFVAGPSGALVGGIAGCVIGYYRSDGYNSMMNVLRGLTEEEKQNLVNEVQDLVGSTAVEDLTTFFGSRARRGALLNCIRHFLKGCSDDSHIDARTHSEDVSPTYRTDWEVPSAPPYQPTYSDPPPPYDPGDYYANIYPNLNIKSTEKQ